MEVRVCPKCQAENRRSSATCSNCFTSLARVPVTQGGAGQTTSVQAPVGAEPTRMGSAPGRTQAPMQTQSGPAYPQPGAQQYQQQISPIPRRSNSPLVIILIVLVLALIGGGALMYPVISRAMRPAPRPTVSAEKVIVQFLDAKKTGKIENVKPFLSENSIAMLNNAFSSRQAQSAGFTKKDSADMLVMGVPPTKEDIEVCDIVATVVKDKEEEQKADEDTVLVQATLTHKPQPENSAQDQQSQTPTIDLDFASGDYEFVLVNEEGKWKVDLALTSRRNRGSIMKHLMPGS